MPFFSPKFKSTANFSAPAQEGNLFFLSGRSARKKIHNFPIKSSHLCPTSRHVWLSSSACDHCHAYQLICIITIGTYTTDGRAEITRQLGSCTVKKRVLAPGASPMLCKLRYNLFSQREFGPPVMQTAERMSRKRLRPIVQFANNASFFSSN